MTFRILTVIPVLLLALAGVNAGAQQADTDAAAASTEPESAAETNEALKVSNDDQDDADASAQDSEEGSDAGRPVNASTDVFVPTEEVSVDKSISMPVDI